MRIFDQDSVNIQKPQTGSTSQVSSGKSRRATLFSTAASEDQVDVSSGSQLHALAFSLGEASRADRVEQLRSLFNSGNYQVDFQALSGAIVNGMLHGG
jgi:anti-sigma28 factor (negative regulator of flagellin synthesis)